MGIAQVHILPAMKNTIVVVDDQSTGRAILEQVVRGLDDRVVVQPFARPVDAVVWATKHVADLVLVDYSMPDMDGIEFVKRLRSLQGYEHVPMVMVTVHDDRKIRYAALDAGITHNQRSLAMSIAMLRGFLMACWILASTSAFAQDDESLPASSDELSVEVLLFAFPGGGEGAELAAGTHFEIMDGTAIETSGTGRYVELEPQVRQLAPAFTRLSASSETKPLLFTAWRQGLSDQQWVTLKASRAGELVGRVLLKPGKPLSVRVELNFRSSDDRMYRMRSTRPAHFNETLYFDHPAFGALVRIGEPGAP